MLLPAAAACLDTARWQLEEIKTGVLSQAPTRLPWRTQAAGRTWMLRVANSTPMVDLDSSENSLRVKRLSRLDLPTPESPISTTLNR